MICRRMLEAAVFLYMLADTYITAPGELPNSGGGKCTSSDIMCRDTILASIVPHKYMSGFGTELQSSSPLNRSSGISNRRHLVMQFIPPARRLINILLKSRSANVPGDRSLDVPEGAPLYPRKRGGIS